MVTIIENLATLTADYAEMARRPLAVRVGRG
jgi:hypothetical protein